MEYLHMYVPDALVSTVSRELDEGRERSLEIVDPVFTRDRAVEAVGRQILLEMRTGGPLHRLRIDALGQDLAIHLVRSHSNLSGDFAATAHRGGLAPWQLKRACEAMEAHLGEDVGLDMLAGIAGCSATHFSRAFKQSMGIPPFQWLLELRIARARELLVDRETPLAEIALAVGFSAQPQFTTAFRRVTGLTPGAYRRERGA